MNLQELFNHDLDEQMPGVLQRMGMGLAAAAGNQRAIGQREIVKITQDLARKIDRWAGTVGGLTADHLRQYSPYKADQLFQSMIAQLQVMYGPDGEIDMDDFKDALLDYVRQRVLSAPVGRGRQAASGLDSKTSALLQKLDDYQLESWIKRAHQKGMDAQHPLLVAAEAELARRAGGVQQPLPLGPGNSPSGATPE